MKTSYLRGLAAAFLSIALFSCGPDRPQSNHIQILFLGHDSKHHDSEQYLPILASHMATRGVHFTYTSNPDDLNAENLSWYDAVMVYANHDSMTVDQEKALVDFVESGKGFLPIHCASYCFRNSDKYVSMVGAQFKEHETGTFTADILDQNHPVMEGLDPFETWDETYVHHLHNEDRTLLMERDGEPWTWVRNQGKGRVFYTAYGHDQRTWENPGFLQLLEKAIFWAVGDQAMERWSKLTLETFTYSDAKIPNYERRDPPPKLQAPLSAEEATEMIQIPVGFELQLFAQEPDIINPISMAWDEKGRLWVIETVDYPNSVRTEDGMGDDRIKICEDTDGDGKADKFTLFAENLNIPTSLVFSNGGVIVSQAPHFLFLKDTDGDDKADIREVLITGWGTSDTHAGPSNLRYGFDNKIWGTVGYSGFEGKVGGKSFDFYQALYNFAPDASSLEVIGHTTNNTWGLGFTEEFHVFASTANNNHNVFLGIPLKHYMNVEGTRTSTTAKIDGHYSFHPITNKYRQVDVFGGFTAAAGHSFYTARSFPKRYWNRVAFVSEPTGHLLHESIIEKDGAGFKEKDGWNTMASPDEWMAPVQAEVGPDGALWVLDWYNFIIQHNPTPTGFDNGPGNAHVNPLRDKKHGRIYRLQHWQAPSYNPMQLDINDAPGLVNALSNDNMFWRLNAQRLLVERGEKDVVADLVKLAESKEVDEVGLNTTVIHALWTIHGLGAIEDNRETVIAALSHPSASVRKNALQVLPAKPWAMEAVLKNALIDDEDLNVRLHAFLRLQEMPPSEQLGEMLLTAGRVKENLNDPWISRAIYCAAATHKEGYLAAFFKDAAKGASLAHEYSAEYNDSAWDTVTMPSYWTGKYRSMRGAVWYRTTVDLPAAFTKGTVELHLPPVNDKDEVWINGSLVGTTSGRTKEPRLYIINSALLKEGTNTVTIRLENYWGEAGITAEPENMYMKAGGEQVSLAGVWKHKLAFETGGLSSPFDTDNPIEVAFARTYAEKEEAPAQETETTTDDNVKVIKLGVVKNELKYDLDEITVKAGQKVRIEFMNNDFMQHNLLIVAPGQLNKVGAEADKLAISRDGAAQSYVPGMPEVLFSTRLVSPNESAVLEFTAPDEKGDYPFVCTFPGHWRIMNGIMRVE